MISANTTIARLEFLAGHMHDRRATRPSGFPGGVDGPLLPPAAVVS